MPSDWDNWAANVAASGGASVDGVILYLKETGVFCGRSGRADYQGDCFKNLDAKASGKGADTIPIINGIKFMFVRNTTDDSPASLFKKGSESMMLFDGPHGTRVVAIIKPDVKAETVLPLLQEYVKPYVK